LRYRCSSNQKFQWHHAHCRDEFAQVATLRYLSIGAILLLLFVVLLLLFAVLLILFAVLLVLFVLLSSGFVYLPNILVIKSLKSANITLEFPYIYKNIYIIILVLNNINSLCVFGFVSGKLPVPVMSHSIPYGFVFCNLI